MQLISRSWAWFILGITIGITTIMILLIPYPKLNLNISGDYLSPEDQRTLNLSQDQYRLLVYTPKDPGLIQEIRHFFLQQESVGQIQQFDMYDVYTTQDIVLDDDTIQTIQLWNQNDKDRRLKNSAYFQQLFIPADDGWISHILFVGRLIDLLDFPQFEQKMSSHGVLFFSPSLMGNRLANETAKTFLIQVVLALVFMTFAGYVICRSIRSVFAMAVSILIPMIWSFLLLPLFNLSVDSVTMTIPFIISAITGPLIVHQMRAYSTGFSPMRGIILSALTSGIAMGLMILSRSIPMQRVGLLLATGIFIGSTSVLILFPALLSLIYSKADQITIRWIILQKPFFPVKKVHKFAYPVIILILISLTVPVITIPSKNIETWGSAFLLPGSQIAKILDIKDRKEINGNEIIISLDSGLEEGILEPEFWIRLSEVENLLKQIPGIRNTFSVLPMVSWFNGRLDGKNIDVIPNSLEQSAETLELLRSFGFASQVDALVSPDYRNAQILVTIDRINYRMGTLNTIKQVLTDNNIDYQLKGSLYLELKTSSQILQNFVADLPLMLTFFFVLLLVNLRSWRMSWLPMVSIIAGLVFYIGTKYVLGPGFSFLDIPFISIIIGVANDDAIFYVLSHGNIQKRNTEIPAILQTTFLFTLFLSPMFITWNTFLIRTILACIVGLWAATLTTLCFLPKLEPPTYAEVDKWNRK